MIIPIESLGKLTAFCILFICGIWLYCSYAKSGRRDADIKGFLFFFILMAMSNFFAGAGMLFLTSNSEEVAVPFYNAALIISNLISYIAYAQIIFIAVGIYFVGVNAGEKAKKYYCAGVVAFGLVITAVSFAYQANPVFDHETYMINSNHNSIVYKMMVAMILMSMGASSLLFIGKIFISKLYFKKNFLMGVGIAIFLAGQLAGEGAKSALLLVFIDTVSILGLVALFYGVNSRNIYKNIPSNLTQMQSYE